MKDPDTKMVKVNSLVIDMDLYPRGRLDTKLGRDYALAMEAGAQFPPILVCASTKKVVDGVKRCRACEILYGDKAEISAVFKRYASDAERLYDAIKAATTQGERLTESDMVRCATLADKFQLGKARLAEAMQRKPERFAALVEGSTAISKTTGERVALKSTLRELLAGKEITKAQEDANEKLVGMHYVYFVNRLIDMFEARLIDWKNENLLERLAYLGDLIHGMKRRTSA